MSMGLQSAQYSSIELGAKCEVEQTLLTFGVHGVHILRS